MICCTTPTSSGPPGGTAASTWPGNYWCLGPFAGEAPTLRAAWSAKGNTRQHSAATLVDRYGIPPSGVRDLLVDYLGEIRPGWTTAR